MSYYQDDSGFSVVKLFMIMVVLAACAAGAYFAYGYFKGDRGNAAKHLSQVGLKPELLAFTYQQMPELYAEMDSLNHRVEVINAEIERLDKLEAEFPRQKRIVVSEKSTLVRNQKELLNCIGSLEKGIEKIYVAYRVNPEAGTALIAGDQPDLVNQASASLKATDELAGRLDHEEPKSLWGTLKTKFNALFQ